MNLIGLTELSADHITSFLDLAETLLDADGHHTTPPKYRQALQRQSVALLFFEPSTRTRVSFELAAKQLGAYTVRLGGQESSVKKGESVLDTCRNLEAMGLDALVVRHGERQLPYAVRDEVDIPLINAGNGSGEHPTQGLMDAFTLRRAFGRRGESLAGKRIAIIGDIVHSRVARSDVQALGKLGCEVVLAGPSMLLPSGGVEGWDAQRAPTRDEALAGADAVIMLRVQHERIHGELIDSDTFVRQWGIDPQVVANSMKPEAFVLHPGPVIRGMELAAPVVDSERSLIFEQAGYGIAMRQAVLLACLSDLN